MSDRALTLGAILSCLGSALAACAPAPREAADCVCSYLTDTDVPGEQATRVCVPRGERPEDAAAECVMGMGVGAVGACRCQPHEGPCGPGRCEQGAAEGARAPRTGAD